jgi:Tol biopolymer transport system component
MPIRSRGRSRLSVVVLAALLFAASSAAAQTAFVPYYGKNQIKYDNFDWQIYTTEHFEIFYYPEIEPHLERVAGYAESAYQHVSSELKHDLAFKVPLILFSTSSEFFQQNVIPGAAQEGVGAFAEPSRNRILMPMDEPSDLLYRLVVHELTHVFQFDIIPTSLIRSNMPLWVMEGMSDYMTGIWRPIDLMFVRDAAVADIVPKMTELNDYGQFSNPRMIYNLGHAAFEFIESRWGKEGVRQFVFSLRKTVIGGGDNAFEEAFQMDPDDWDQQFDRYLKERFKPFRDKERPADYGRDLAPNPMRSKYSSVLSIEPSPSGDLVAAMTGNRKDRELDIVLISTKDGQVIRNLTNGFDQDKGFEYIPTPGMRYIIVPWMSWSPQGDRLAYFVRTEKDRSLILQNVLSSKIESRIEMDTVDAPESPDFSPDGKLIAFAASRGVIGDIFTVNLETREVVNLTNDDFADYAPTWSPDGRFLVYMKRVSGNEKLFRFDLASGKSTQLTFGAHDESGAQFLDADTLVFTSTATDPAKAIDPEVARNGNVHNVWTLNLKTGQLQQYTDALAGNYAPVVLTEGGEQPRVAFVTYYKGEYGMHVLERKEPLNVAASDDFGAPGPVIDFQAPMTHTLVAANKKKKGKFEKLFLDGRPPVNLGVTSGGDFFGGTQISFTDVLGDQQFSMFAASVSQYRTMSFNYLNLDSRFQWAVQGYSQTQFFYGQLENIFYDPAFSGLFLDRDLAVATRTIRGGTVFGIYPFNRYRRIEVYGGFVHYQEQFDDPGVEQYSRDYQEQTFGRQLFNNGSMMPLGLAFTQETTIFREFGPLAGSTMRLGYEFAPRIGDSTLSRQTVDVDARKYLRLGGSGLLALRARGFRSWGDNPDFMYFGGNSEMRGYDYLSFVGQDAFYLNAELRFPLIEAMATPIGILGGIRGAFFANLGGATWSNQPFKLYTKGASIERPVLNYDPTTLEPVLGAPVVVDGFRLVDGRASYGISLQTFALGFPVHFDWSWKTLFNKDWEDIVFSTVGGSSAFRKPKFTMWIGYDF